MKLSTDEDAGCQMLTEKFTPEMDTVFEVSHLIDATGKFCFSVCLSASTLSAAAFTTIMRLYLFKWFLSTNASNK